MTHYANRMGNDSTNEMSFEENKAKVRIDAVKWLKSNPTHPLLNAIINWTGKRNTEYYDEGYCRMISSLYRDIIGLPEEHTSSGSHTLYGILSDTIVKWARGMSLIPEGTPFEVLSDEELSELVEACRKKFCYSSNFDTDPEIPWNWKKGDWAWMAHGKHVVLVYEVNPGPYSKVNISPSCERGTWIPKTDLVPLPIHGEHGIPIPFPEHEIEVKSQYPCECGVPYVPVASGIVWCDKCKQHFEIVSEGIPSE